MAGMDHSSMSHGMDMPAATPPPTDKAGDDPTPADPGGMDHSSMNHGAMDGMDMDHAHMDGMSMGPMQGGSAPADARNPDYSDGLHHGSMQAMDMNDAATRGTLMIDQLEAWSGRDSQGQRWEAEGWYGGDVDKLWIRTEGERTRGSLDEADVELLWSHAVSTFWDTQLGVRHDTGEGPARQWAAFGIKGLAPYWFELEATAYAGPSGRTAARFKASYELLFTQRLILEPELEFNAYGNADRARATGSGLSDAQLGLRLRYEFSRSFAPYVGVKITHDFGQTARFTRARGDRITDLQWVAGLRLWF
nr:copper resistance protein B [Luteibacter sp. Sphag1AF]